MSSSNAYVELTPDRLQSATTVVSSAWIALLALRKEYPSVVGDLPERLAVLEGLLGETWFEVAVAEALSRGV